MILALRFSIISVFTFTILLCRKMSSGNSIKIDAEAVKTKIVEFISTTLEKRDIDGLIVLYSGKSR